jgi:hypothetical protein
MDVEDFLKRYVHESDEARVSELFKNLEAYFQQMPDMRQRIASIHLIIKKLRNLSLEYERKVKNTS